MSPIKTLFIVPVALACSMAFAADVHAQKGAMLAAPSGRATSEVTLTFADSAARASAKPAVIRVDYGQPHLRGRTLYTDTLVPYDKVWRLGANDATMLTTDVDLTIGGVQVPKGKWVLEALPARTGWKLLIKKPAAAGVANATPTDFATVDLTATTAASATESLSIAIIPSRAGASPNGELRISWGTVVLSTRWAMR